MAAERSWESETETATGRRRGARDGAAGARAGVGGRGRDGGGEGGEGGGGRATNSDYLKS